MDMSLIKTSDCSEGFNKYKKFLDLPQPCILFRSSVNSIPANTEGASIEMTFQQHIYVVCKPPMQHSDFSSKGNIKPGIQK